jgi:hypothetical protein
VQFALLLLSVVGCIGLAIVFIVGWRRWLRRSSPQGRLSALSLAGFTLGSASVVLAIGSIVYSMAVGGFRYYDPSLLTIYRVGLLLSLVGFVLAFCGVWKRNPLRWHAPALSLGMLLLWFIWASGE